MGQEPSVPPERAAAPGTGTPPRRPRGRPSGLRSLALVALIGGLVGGAVVALIGWWTGWATHDETPASSGSCSVERVADKALRSVVTISITSPTGGGTGSGVVHRLSSGDEVIITNAHVVIPPSGGTAPGGGSPNEGTPTPTSVTVTYADGNASSARVTGVDEVTDLAVVTPSDPSSSAPPLTVGDSGSLRVGTPVVALGSPLGLSSTVTSGIVSATGRYIRVPTETGAAHLVGAIQTDAAINPGNSGGALVDCHARLVGINSAGASPAGESGSAGLGFAIPTSLATPLVAELAENGRVAHPTLGMLLAPVPPELQSTAGAPIVVQAVASGGPADRAGVLPGDAVTEVDGHRLHSPDDLVPIELGLSVGDRVPVQVVRNGEQKSVTVQAAAS